MLKLEKWDKCGRAKRLYEALAGATAGGERWLTRHQGRDHFIVNRFMVWEPTCEGVTWGTTPGSFFDNTIKFALELKPQVNGRVITKDMLPIAEATGIPTEILKATLPARHSHSVPYPSFFHDGLEGSATKPDAFPWAVAAAATTPRPHLAMYAAGMHGNAVELRGLLQEVCTDDPRCEFKGIPKNPADRTAEWFGSLANAMLSATFCLHPAGDSPSRKGIIDSVLLGCIPVLFSKPQLKLWPWHWDAKNASVYLDGATALEGGLDILSALEDLPKSRVDELRRAGRVVAYQMQYNTRDVAGRRDAFDIIMEHLAQMMPAKRPTRRVAAQATGGARQWAVGRDRHRALLP